MAFTGINIQGNILSAEIIEKIRLEDSKFFQKPSDFNLSKNTTVRDEINIAWSAAKAHWDAFTLRREKLAPDDTGTTETRQSWIVPFLTEMGYELELQRKAEIINEKTYLISHRAINRDEFPVNIVGINQSLDKRAEFGGARLSPHALVQEYLNNHDHLYAIVTNGCFLRLLRDATRLSRLSYLEFNLERIMEENLFNEFALLYRLLHVSRMPSNMEEGENSIIEFYHQESLASGSRIRENLSEAVEKAITSLANGFLQNPSNDTLRQDILEEKISPAELYLYQLRMVYRLLFLMVIEERNLIYPESKDENVRRLRKLYYDHFSLKRFREMAIVSIYIDPRQHDLWEGMKTTFSMFEDGKYGKSMGIDPLGSGLFASDALGDLRNVKLDNATFLQVLRILTTFENEQKQLVRVNYGDLDVEEFGSVYEGLLEYDAEIKVIGGIPHFSFKEGTGRSKSGSHYTPEELVKPLIQHSLDYLIKDCIEKPEERLKSIKVPPGGGTTAGHREQALLSLKVADVACGSGHILLSAARRIGIELARVRTREQQPTPPAIRQATRDVIRNCIYGVDLNPLAVELCKVALWLEAHNPGEPLNFLDHHIKCGDAIVGLAHFEELQNGIPSEAFKTLPGDDKEIAVAYRKRNEKERKLKSQIEIYEVAQTDNQLKDVIKDYSEIIDLPEETPEEILQKRLAYQDLVTGPKWKRIKTLADIQVAQFFIPKTTQNKDNIISHSKYIGLIKTPGILEDLGQEIALSIAQAKRFFHYFLEFPEVFTKGGFDCILGNPPYLGGRKISTLYGDNFLNFLKDRYQPNFPLTDYVIYFLKRISEIVKSRGYVSLISTSTIYEGESRRSGLEVLINGNWDIIFGMRLIRWPGRANLNVALIALSNFNWDGIRKLDNKNVYYINSHFEENIQYENPHKLFINIGKSGRGYVPLGDGFVISHSIAQSLIKSNKKNEDVIFQFLSGDDVNNNSTQKPSRSIIYFADMDIECAEKYKEPFTIIKEKVYPERQKKKQLDYKTRWWQFGRQAKDIAKEIKNLNRFFLAARVTKYLNFIMGDPNIIFSDANVAVAFEEWQYFYVLQSNIFDVWARTFSTTLGDSLRFTAQETCETFPYPDNIITKLRENDALNFYSFRSQLMIDLNIGLTEIYNLYHCQGLTKHEINLKNKQIQILQKLINSNQKTLSFESAIKGILRLRELHVHMDEAVMEAYGWHEDSEKWGPAIQLRHDFYEVDYLPENDRIRFTIHPDARKEVLKRLLKLNHEIHEEEVRKGLWDKSSSKGKGKSSKVELKSKN